MEQSVARWAHNPKVTGSSPVPATKGKPGGKYKVICSQAFFFVMPYVSSLSTLFTQPSQDLHRHEFSYIHHL